MRNKPVIIKGRYYESIAQAARQSPRGTYRWRPYEVSMRVHSSDYPNWRLATDEEINHATEKKHAWSASRNKPI